MYRVYILRIELLQIPDFKYFVLHDRRPWLSPSGTAEDT